MACFNCASKVWYFLLKRCNLVCFFRMKDEEHALSESLRNIVSTIDEMSKEVQLNLPKKKLISFISLPCCKSCQLNLSYLFQIDQNKRLYNDLCSQARELQQRQTNKAWLSSCQFSYFLFKDFMHTFL